MSLLRSGARRSQAVLEGKRAVSSTHGMVGGGELLALQAHLGPSKAHLETSIGIYSKGMASYLPNISQIQKENDCALVTLVLSHQGSLPGPHHLTLLHTAEGCCPAILYQFTLHSSIP